jgi:hypothetical protein
VPFNSVAFEGIWLDTEFSTGTVVGNVERFRSMWPLAHGDINSIQQEHSNLETKGAHRGFCGIIAVQSNSPFDSL